MFSEIRTDLDSSSPADYANADLPLKHMPAKPMETLTKHEGLHKHAKCNFPSPGMYNQAIAQANLEFSSHQLL
jgi:hypothetical protein